MPSHERPVGPTSFGPDPSPVLTVDGAAATVGRRARASLEDAVSHAPAPGATPSAGGGRRVAASGSIGGRVTNTWRRGLRFVTVSVVDDDEGHVAHAVTGAGGTFAIEGLPMGSYRVLVTDDLDEDLARTWWGGDAFATADPVTVDPGHPLRRLDVAVRSASRLDVVTTGTDDAVELAVSVVERATGAPAGGRVRLSSVGLDVTVRLARGRAAVTIGRDASGLYDGALVAVDYLGTEHVAGHRTSVRL